MRLILALIGVDIGFDTGGDRWRLVVVLTGADRS